MRECVFFVSFFRFGLFICATYYCDGLSWIKLLLHVMNPDKSKWCGFQFLGIFRCVVESRKQSDCEQQKENETESFQIVAELRLKCHTFKVSYATWMGRTCASHQCARNQYVVEWNAFLLCDEDWKATTSWAIYFQGDKNIPLTIYLLRTSNNHNENTFWREKANILKTKRDAFRIKTNEIFTKNFHFNN